LQGFIRFAKIAMSRRMTHGTGISGIGRLGFWETHRSLRHEEPSI
jgi:hypothetical protein